MTELQFNSELRYLVADMAAKRQARIASQRLDWTIIGMHFWLIYFSLAFGLKIADHWPF